MDDESVLFQRLRKKLPFGNEYLHGGGGGGHGGGGGGRGGFGGGRGGFGGGRGGFGRMPYGRPNYNYLYKYGYPRYGAGYANYVAGGVYPYFDIDGYDYDLSWLLGKTLLLNGAPIPPDFNATYYVYENQIPVKYVISKAGSPVLSGPGILTVQTDANNIIRGLYLG